MFFAAGDADAIVPFHLMQQSADIVKAFHTATTFRVYPGLDHSVSPQVYTVFNYHKSILIKWHISPIRGCLGNGRYQGVHRVSDSSDLNHGKFRLFCDRTDFENAVYLMCCTLSAMLWHETSLQP